MSHLGVILVAVTAVLLGVSRFTVCQSLLSVPVMSTRTYSASKLANTIDASDAYTQQTLIQCVGSTVCEFSNAGNTQGLQKGEEQSFSYVGSYLSPTYHIQGTELDTGLSSSVINQSPSAVNLPIMPTTEFTNAFEFSMKSIMPSTSFYETVATSSEKIPILSSLVVSPLLPISISRTVPLIYEAKPSSHIIKHSISLSSSIVPGTFIDIVPSTSSNFVSVTDTFITSSQISVFHVQNQSSSDIEQSQNRTLISELSSLASAPIFLKPSRTISSNVILSSASQILPNATYIPQVTMTSPAVKQTLDPTKTKADSTFYNRQMNVTVPFTTLQTGTRIRGMDSTIVSVSQTFVPSSESSSVSSITMSRMSLSLTTTSHSIKDVPPFATTNIETLLQPSRTQVTVHPSFALPTSNSFSSSIVSNIEATTTTPINKLESFQDRRLLLVFSGDCKFIINNEDYTNEFKYRIREIISAELSVALWHVKVGPIFCGSVKTYVTLKNVSESSLSRLSHLVKAQNFSVVIGKISQKTYTATHISEMSIATNRPVNRKPVFTSFRLSKIDIIVITVASVVSVCIIGIGITACTRKYRHFKRRQSYNLRGRTRTRLDDYMLGRFPRPKSLYADLDPINGYYSTHSNCGTLLVRPTSVAQYSDISVTDLPYMRRSVTDDAELHRYDGGRLYDYHASANDTFQDPSNGRSRSPEAPYSNINPVFAPDGDSDDDDDDDNHDDADDDSIRYMTTNIVNI